MNTLALPGEGCSLERLLQAIDLCPTLEDAEPLVPILTALTAGLWRDRFTGPQLRLVRAALRRALAAMPDAGLAPLWRRLEAAGGLERLGLVAALDLLVESHSVRHLIRALNACADHRARSRILAGIEAIADPADAEILGRSVPIAAETDWPLCRQMLRTLAVIRGRRAATSASLLHPLTEPAHADGLVLPACGPGA